MKRIIAILISVLLCFAALVGCSAVEEAADEQSQEPVVITPEPTPEPDPVVAVVTDSESPNFSDGVKSILQGASVQLLETNGDIEAGAAQAAEAGANVIIAYASKPDTDLSALSGLEAEVLVFDACGNKEPEGVTYYGYDTTDAQSLILETLLNLPNHDTPVRLLGMFTSAESEAASTFAGAVSEGKVFNKGCYYEDTNESTPEEWIASALESNYPGMLDAVYAEDERMAGIAFEAMGVSERTDAEVVSAFTSDMSEQAVTNSYVYRGVVCPNTYYIGAYLANTALAAIDGAEISGSSFSPDVIFASSAAEGAYMTERMLELYPF